jgi:hypothetical protein
MKQTAVEWLQDTWLNYPDLCSYDKIQEWFKQAKEMEKEQRIQDYSVGYSNGQVDSNRTAEQYYNETFKSE